MVALKMKDRIMITVDSRLGRWGQDDYLQQDLREVRGKVR